MIPVACYVADFNLRPGFPVISDLSLSGRPIAAFLREASGTSSIELSFDFSRRGRVPELVSSRGVNEDQMTGALARVLAPVQAGPPSIGLLMADSLAQAPKQFGSMFDIDDGDGVGPRQGCAVFLTAIALAMGTDNLTDKASREFISFIALHELGHAFNLWHVDDDSVMQTHPQVNAMGSLQFEETQRHFLSLASQSTTANSVLPGAGCAAYGARPAGFPPGDGSLPAASPSRGKRNLALQIGLSSDALWPFEPIELDVSLSLPKDATRAVAVPDEIDPGYPSFQIWITRPDGVRFRYRPALRFCGRNGKLMVRSDQPYVRDIALGRQSGRYTFEVPGEYQVQAALAMRSGEFIMSNVARCTVKPVEPLSPQWLAAKAALDNGEARRLLQYKRRAPPLETYASLQRYADEASTSPQTCAAIHFAIGRSLVDTATSVGGRQDQPLLQQGRRHLHQALERNCLSTKRVLDINTRL